MPSSIRTRYTQFISTLDFKSLFPYLVIFCSLFALARLGVFLLMVFHAPGAVVWLPMGIALAAVYLYGYRALLPIGLAAFLVSATSGFPLSLSVAATAASVSESLVALVVMRTLGFRGTLERGRDVFILLAIACLVTMVVPSITTPVEAAAHLLSDSPLSAWLRTWSAGVLSVLVVMPVFTTWFSGRPFHLTRRQYVEVSSVFAALTAVTLFLFWSPFAKGGGLLGFYALLALLSWVALRLEVRFMTLALFCSMALGFLGTVLVHPGAVSVTQSLFSDELFFEFVSVIFLVFSAVAAEKRATALELRRNIVDLQAAVERISSEDRAKSEFIAILAHELRNPLSPVVSTLEWLELEQLSSEALHAIASAKAHTFTMKRLLDDLLDVARVSQQHFTLSREVVDLRTLVARSVGDVAYLKERGHRFVLTLPPEQVWMSVDPIRFEQVLSNLLTNAAKYTPSGGRIELYCSTQGENLNLEVRDNGIGLAPEHLESIFEPFRQVKAGTTVAGLGIGLFLSKRLVEMHGGRITVASDGLGRGSTFSISLPLPPKELVPVPSSVVLAPRKKNGAKTLNILVVDDNCAAADGLAKLLRYKGHTVRVVYDGTKALSEVLGAAPDVLLLDIGLPDIDGYEVTRRLRASGSSATIIALTGYGQEEDKQRAKEAGFDLHLTKPVGLAEVEAAITKTYAAY
jgi:signal transduction histidine kinase/CheY-like chemotaxis protein